MIHPMIWSKQSHTEILEVLGEGLTSRVYRAIRKHRSLNVQQVVALKVLHSQEQIQSLKNEIELLLTVDSPYCVKLLGWEETSKGLAIVLEYLDGVSLEELCRWRALSLDQVDEIIYQIQEGLKELHKKQIVHGDISLKNIFITKEGCIKIIDFGFSSKERKKFDYGTPSCMSLEAWSGDKLVLGSDLFSLGLLRETLLATDLNSRATFEYWRRRAESFKNHNCLLIADPTARKFLDLKHNNQWSKSLAATVKDLKDIEMRAPSTIKLSSSFCAISRKQLLLKKVLALFLATVASITVSASIPTDPIFIKRASLDVRSRDWVRTELYKMNRNQKRLYQSGYAPILFNSLIYGEYVLYWTSHLKSGKIHLSVNEDQKVIINTDE